MKYEPLKTYLEAAGGAAVALSFEQIEQIIGAPLPASARKHAAWWSNSPTGHVNAQAWLRAGYASTRVDLAAERLAFVPRAADAETPWPGVAEGAEPSLKPPGAGFLERIRARLGGTVWIAPGVDLTEPTGEIWNAEIE